MEWASERQLSLLLYGAIDSNSIQNLKLSSSSPMLENNIVAVTLLQAGGQGFVYNVVKTEEPYFVIKVFKAGKEKSFEIENRFFDLQTESEAYHDNITKRLEVLNIADDQGLYKYAILLPKYIIDAFDYCMEKLAPTKTPEPKITENLANDVIRGLEHIHTKFKLAHCDIKPENIMIKTYSPELVFVIVDFGIVLSMDEENTKKLLTTRDYNKKWIKCPAKPQGINEFDGEIVLEQRGKFYFGHLQDHTHESQVWLSSGFLSVPWAHHGNILYQPEWRGIDTSLMSVPEVSKLVDNWGLMITLFMFQLFVYPWNVEPDIPVVTLNVMYKTMVKSIDGCFKECNVVQNFVKDIINKLEEYAPLLSKTRKRPLDEK